MISEILLTVSTELATNGMVALIWLALSRVGWSSDAYVKKDGNNCCDEEIHSLVMDAEFDKPAVGKLRA
jgi:hypothetical protein